MYSWTVKLNVSKNLKKSCCLPTNTYKQKFILIPQTWTQTSWTLATEWAEPSGTNLIVYEKAFRLLTQHAPPCGTPWLSCNDLILMNDEICILRLPTLLLFLSLSPLFVSVSVPRVFIPHMMKYQNHTHTHARRHAGRQAGRSEVERRNVPHVWTAWLTLNPYQDCSLCYL